MQHPLKLPDGGSFPQKLFYKIGEVSRIAGVESHVLRYWESEFPFLRPKKSRAGQRVYTRREVDLILEIKLLPYDEKYTIDGVRKRLGGGKRVSKADSPSVKAGVGQEGLVSLVRERLEKILGSL
ncbi:MAG: MerR family transcriptional regulator [Nitrospirales bacterium]|nr:MerR family transcriptional regulator [Nitrospirales bacterium]